MGRKLAGWASGGWTGFLKSYGKTRTHEALKCAIEADCFLLHAVLSTDIDWCITRLEQVKRDGPKAKRMLDIVMDTALDMPSGSG
jgi:hypothetical protein